MPDFNWDAFIAKATFEEVRERSPTLDALYRPCPSMYGPDRSWFYVSSQDDQVSVHDMSALESMRARVADMYRDAVARGVGPGNVGRLFSAVVDHRELCSLLVAVVEDPERYGDPDSLLASN